MGMNTKVQGRLPLLQCITFHSLLVFEEFVVRKIYLVKHQKSKTHISFKFTRIREGIGSTRRGILGTYSSNFRTKDSAVLNGSNVSISTQSEEGKNAKALDYRNSWIIRRSSWRELGGQSITTWLAEIQLMSRMTYEQEGQISGFDWWLRAIAT